MPSCPDPVRFPVAHALWARDAALRSGTTTARYDGRGLLTEEEVDRMACAAPTVGERFGRHRALRRRRHLQRIGIHETAYTTGDVDERVQVCTCGLLCPIDVRLTAAVGHRAVPGLPDVVHVLAVTGPQECFRLVCQRCGHQMGGLSGDDALRARAGHEQKCRPALPWSYRQDGAR